MAFDTLRANKLRSFLTIFGVVVGVITVMLISSIISGINVAVEKQVEAFRHALDFLYKMDIGIRISQPTREERMRKPLTLDDAEAFGTLPADRNRRSVSRCFEQILWGKRRPLPAKTAKQTPAVNLSGTLAGDRENGHECCIEGRWFTQAESDAKRTFVLSAILFGKLSSRTNPRSAKRSKSAGANSGSSAF